MFLKRDEMIWVIAIFALTGTLGCVLQEGGNYVSKSAALDMRADDLVGANEFLYALDGRIICLGWKGNTLWESPELNGRSMIFLGDTFLPQSMRNLQRNEVSPC